ncbi:MAG: hypothetical protein JNM39_09720 [Bdellovibrionaceae bacterium]|nr:hypothetical protein [Pseudobdellovibrionaceae bacterium]
MNQSATLTIFIVFIATVSLADAPTWSKGPTVKRVGATALVTCQGEGLSRDLSFQAATQSCAAIAATEKSSEFTSKQVVIETERESAKLFSSVESNKQISGLHGKTEKESTTPTETGFVTYLQVRYDLNVATVTTVSDTSDAKPEAQLLIVPNNEKPSIEIERKSISAGLDRSITIQMIPEKCADFLVRGKRPRSHKCSSTVMHVTVNPTEDTEIILRPSDNHLLPVLIKVNRQPANAESEVVDVVFPRSK